MRGRITDERKDGNEKDKEGALIGRERRRKEKRMITKEK